MKKPIIQLVAMFGVLSFAAGAQAVDLMDVYHQSLTSDPTFQSARAQWQSDQENVGISLAALLPQFDVKAGFNYSRTSSSYIDDLPGSTLHNGVSSYSLTLQQPIFNFAAWAGLRGAKASVKASTATYSYAVQDLMLRVATAYFGVLQAQDELRYTLAEKRSIGRQLERTRERYKVGLIAVTAVYQAQASYDNVTAQEIEARNALANSKEQLREITGQHYETYATLGDYLPLLKPNPVNIDQWVTVAEKQNYNLLAAQYTSFAAKENISEQMGNNFPVVNGTGSYGYSKNNNPGDVSNLDHQNVATLGVNMDFPVFQGGGTWAKTKQAEYLYQKSLSDFEKSHRSVISQTRQAYLGVLSKISKINADKQAIVSNDSALKATEAGYIVGTQTMVDVLNVQADLYQAQKDYAVDQYAYILQTLTLKEAAGTISVADLEKINSWLKAKVSSEDMKDVDTSANGNNSEQKPVVKTTAPAKKVVAKKAPVNKPEVVKSSVTKATVTVSSPLTGIEKQILSVNPNHYTIQLIADQNQQTVMNYVNKSNINEKTFCFSTKKNGATWYKLIAGDYATKAKAEAALNKLKAQGLKSLWLRQYSSVQKEIG